jgi:GDP-L-fucose synthase
MADNTSLKVFVAGHRGLVGSALVRALERRGFGNIIVRTHAELDLTEQAATREFLQRVKPDWVLLAAARVGGIVANSTYGAEFAYQNLMIATNVIDAAHRAGCKKLLNLGSSCVYPREAPQPIAESSLLTGPLEITNEPYAIAKIAAIKLCAAYNRQYKTDFLSVMPSNLYGPGDNYHPENSHVLPGLIRRFHEAKRAGAPEVVVWGSGKPRREFLHSDDLAEACLMLMERHSASEIGEILNIGPGNDISIAELAQLVSEAVGYSGRIVHDLSRPDGTFRKVMEVSRIQALGWKPQVELRAGIAAAYRDYLNRLG